MRRLGRKLCFAVFTTLIIAASGCDSQRGEDRPIDQRLEIAAQGDAVPDVRGFDVRRARAVLSRARLVPEARRSGQCLVHQQSPIPGSRRARGARIRLYLDCREAPGSCGLLPQWRGVETVRRAGRTDCGTVRRVLSAYRRRAPREGQGNGAFVQIGAWSCNRLPAGGETGRPFPAFAGCGRKNPRAEIVLVER